MLRAFQSQEISSNLLILVWWVTTDYVEQGCKTVFFNLDWVMDRTIQGNIQNVGSNTLRHRSILSQLHLLGDPFASSAPLPLPMSSTHHPIPPKNVYPWAMVNWQHKQIGWDQDGSDELASRAHEMMSCCLMVWQDMMSQYYASSLRSGAFNLMQASQSLGHISASVTHWCVVI